MEKIGELTRLLSDSVERLCKKKTAVIYSAGVDSTLLAYIASRYSEVTAYIVGVEGAEDPRYSDMIEKTAPFNIKKKVLSIEDIEKAIPKISKITGSDNPLDIGVGIPFYFASLAAAEDGFTEILCGQGSDELFGGYWRYVQTLVEKGEDSLRQMMEDDWKNAYRDNLDRDIKICKSNGLTLLFPFLDERFSDLARSLPLDEKIKESDEMPNNQFAGRPFIRKYIFKKLAIEYGLPEKLVNRPKKAAQYGSGSQKILEKIAREDGFKKKAAELGRRDYLKYYCEQLLGKP